MLKHFIRQWLACNLSLLSLRVNFPWPVLLGLLSLNGVFLASSAIVRMIPPISMITDCPLVLKPSGTGSVPESERPSLPVSLKSSFTESFAVSAAVTAGLLLLGVDNGS